MNDPLADRVTSRIVTLVLPMLSSLPKIRPSPEINDIHSCGERGYLPPYHLNSRATSRRNDWDRSVFVRASLLVVVVGLQARFFVFCLRDFVLVFFGLLSWVLEI